MDNLTLRELLDEKQIDTLHRMAEQYDEIFKNFIVFTAQIAIQIQPLLEALRRFGPAFNKDILENIGFNFPSEEEPKEIIQFHCINCFALHEINEDGLYLLEEQKRIGF